MEKLLITGFLLLNLTSAFSQDGNNVRLDPEEFAIMPWGWMPAI